MVQIQSTWFPLYDRNPQTWVDNIFFAQPADYRPATHRVFRSGNTASFVELPVVGWSRPTQTPDPALLPNLDPVGLSQSR